MVEHSEPVFLERLVSETKKSEKSGQRVSTLVILQRWKGPAPTKTVDIVWWGKGLFLSGVTYLVYALRDSSELWHVESNVCGYRVLLPAKADAHLQSLGPPTWEYKAYPRDEPTTLHNKALQTDKIQLRRVRESAARDLLVLRTQAVGGSRDLATISDILDETP